MFFILTTLFCVTFTCEDRAVVRTVYPSQEAAVEAYKVRDPRTDPRLFKVDFDVEGSSRTYGLVVGPSPAFVVAQSAPGAVIPQ